MRRGSIALAVALLLALAGLAALLISPPAGLVQNRIAAAIKDGTGRDLAVHGNASLKLLPSIVLRLENVALSNPPGIAGEPFLRAGAVELHAAFWPVLRGRFEISRITFAEPRLQLVVNHEGRTSWQLATGPRGPTAGSPMPAIGELAISRGTVTFRDERLPTRRAELADVNAIVQRIAFDAPLSAAFDFLWQDEKIEGKASVQSLAALRDGAATRTAIILASARGNAQFDGELTAAVAPRLAGKASGNTASLRALAGWLGFNLPPADGFGKTALEGELRAEGRSVSFANARLSLDDTTAQGSLGLDFAGERPRVTGRIVADRVDAARYLPAPGRAAAPEALTRSAPSPDFEIVAVPLKESLKAYLKAAETRGPSAAAAAPEAPSLEAARAPASAWSAEPFDVQPLNSVDLDLDLSVGAVELRQSEIRGAKLLVALEDGKLALETKELAAHGGKLSGKTVIDAKPGVPTLAASVSLDQVDLRGLLSDLGIEGYVAGKTTGEAEISGAGRSERELVASLSGRVKARVGEGVVVGYDVKQAVDSRRLPAFNPAARTPFERIDADVRLDKGVAQSSVMELAGPVFGVKADGTARLAPRQLDYRARVSFANWWSFALRIFGSWQKLSYDVDWWSTLFSRSTPAATRLGVAEALDLQDPELAQLLERALQKSTTTRAPDDLDPDVLRVLLKKAKGNQP